MQSAGTRLCTIIALDFVCQNRNPWSCVRSILPNERRLDKFPTAVIVHFPGNCEVITGCYFIWIFPEKVGRCEEDGLSPLLALFSSRNESILKDGVDVEGTTAVKHKLFLIVRNHNVSINSSAIVIPPVCPWIARKEVRVFWNPRNARTSSCYLHHGCVEANLFLRNLVLLCPRNLSAISALSCPNELLHQIVVLLGHNGAPILWPFWRSLLKEILLCTMNGRNKFPLPFLRRCGSFCVVHWAERKTDRVRIQFRGARIRGRTNFLSASLRFCQARFTFFRVFLFRE